MSRHKNLAKGCDHSVSRSKRIAAAVLGAIAFCAACWSDPVGVPFDLQGHIDQAVRAGITRIVVPPGRYRVTPKDRQHLLLRDLKDIEIIADDVEMICTETTRALTLTHCTNVTVRGLIIDYDPLPFTQGRITGFSADKQIHEIELFDGYPAAATARNFKYEIFRPDTRTLRCDDRYPSRVEATGPMTLRIHIPSGRATDPEQVGDIIVIGSEDAPHGSAAHAVECSRSVNVRLEDIDLFASNCFGFLEYDCDRTTYLRCRIDRRPPEDDLVQRADPRIRSLDADAFHSKHAIRGPAYLECTARFMGDDALNICGDYHLIMGSQGRDLRVLAKHDLNLQSGDPVELVLYTGLRLPDAKVVTVRRTDSIHDDERTFLSRQRMNESLKTARGALTKAYTLTLDREVDIARGGVICAANRVGSGFVVKNCTFGYNRSRGILIKGSRGEVSHNHLQGSRMSAILVSPEYWWLEAGSSSDLTIHDNTIRQCGGVPILVQAIGGNGDIAPAGAHRNVSITGNTVSDCTLPGILVTSTSALQIGDNVMTDWSPSRGIPGIMRQVGLRDLQPVVRIHCEE